MHSHTPNYVLTHVSPCVTVAEPSGLDRWPSSHDNGLSCGLVSVSIIFILKTYNDWSELIDNSNLLIMTMIYWFCKGAVVNELSGLFFLD